MNPMAASYLDQINAALDDLREAIVEQREGLKKEREKRDELLKRYWSGQKKITVLDQGREEYAILKAENEQLKDGQRELRNRLETVFEMCKTLREGLQE